MKRAALLLVIVPSILLGGVLEWPVSLMIVNGHILTMDADNSVAEALLIEGQYIVAIGDLDYVQSRAPEDIRVIDLQGSPLMPGFVDAHSHFPSSGLAQAGLDLAPAVSGSLDSLSDLLLRVSAAASSQPENQWIVGFNYDDASLLEERHPTRQELDEAAPNHAVYLWHRSGHMGVANTRALKALGHLEGDSEPISAASAHVGRDSQGRLNGLLQEQAAPELVRLLQELPKRKLIKVLDQARDEYLKAGITTVQNGFADILSMHVLKWAQRIGVLHQRVVIWPGHAKLGEHLVANLDQKHSNDSGLALANAIGWTLQDREQFAVSAVKLIVDGSPQGRTAWLSKPYKKDPALTDGYRGLPVIAEDDLVRLVRQYHHAGFQLALHGNGDAAIDAIIKALDIAQAEYPRKDARHFIVHAQTIRHDQLEQLAQLDVGVSFFPAHTLYWGDWYRTKVLGEERARLISPLAKADELGVRYSIHSDAPVTPIDPMQMLWTAINRRTLSKVELDATLSVSRLRALRAMTIDAAWQNHLDHDRGSLEEGKLADMISLSGNPLLVDDVRDVEVLKVWIGGRERYRHSLAVR
ncbi:MAG: amidohydrolase [Granulosicoccus sp.]